MQTKENAENKMAEILMAVSGRQDAIVIQSYKYNINQQIYLQTVVVY